MKRPTSKKGSAAAIRPLVVSKLEMVSKDVFRNHFDLITELIGDSPGVYALYDDKELYYVGKSTDLRNRVKYHLRDRHVASWTHFSLYLARKEEHIHEIESLIVRVASPKGNRVVPKGKSSGPLLNAFKKMIRQRQKEELAKLFGTGRATLQSLSVRKGRRTLVDLVKHRTLLFRTYKGKDYKATLSPKGVITSSGISYNTATAAAKAITGRSVNGLSFWYIQDLNGDWVKLGELIKRRIA